MLCGNNGGAYFMNNLGIVFYVVGEKGLKVIQSVVDGYCDKIHQVVIGTDSGVINDFSKDIERFCIEHGIVFSYRGSEPKFSSAVYRICIGWRWIINDSKNLIVLHDSKLPEYRGFNPLVTALLNKDESISVSAIIANESFDQGDILCSQTAAISYPIKLNDAISISIDLYIRVVSSIVKMLCCDGFTPQKQDELQASYSVWRDSKDYFIDWGDSADYISRFCDSVGYPYDGAKTYLKDDLVRIVDSEVVADVNVVSRNKNHGKVLFFSEGKPVVICGSGLIKIIKIEKVSDGSEIEIKSIRTRFYS